MKQIAWIVLGWSILVMPGYAASFDCTKAATKVEKLICSDADLSKLDEELSAAYKTASQDEKQANAIRQAQKQWMKERNDCADMDCVKRAYETRLLSLRSMSSFSTTSSVNENYSDYALDPNPRNYAGRADLEGEPFEPTRDPKVCGLYLENLRYFARRNLPISCGQPVAPTLTDKINPVQWENLDPEKYPELFKAMVAKMFPPAKASEQKSYPSEATLSLDRERVQTGVMVFRRAKLDLRGYLAFPPLNRPSEKTYQIVQFGFNRTDPENSEPGWSCEQNAGRVLPEGRRNDRDLFIASKNLSELYGRLYDLQLGYQSYFNLWLINGHPYGEQYDSKGTVLLSALESETIVHLERACLFHYTKTLKKDN